LKPPHAMRFMSKGMGLPFWFEGFI
jgi:hypothetical protein